MSKEDPPAKNLSASDSDNSSTSKRPRGRPKGYPKSGGRQAPLKLKPGRLGRAEIAERSQVLDFLCRLCAGKPVRVPGPTGKSGNSSWHTPTFEERRWAADRLLPRVLPSLATQHIGGDPDADPISLRSMSESSLSPERELSRRIAFLLDGSDREIQRDAPGGASRPGDGAPLAGAPGRAAPQGAGLGPSSSESGPAPLSTVPVAVPRRAAVPTSG